MRDCNNCHRIGHVPTDIMYSPDTLSVVCVDCHAEPFNTMFESDSEHRYIECVNCHPDHETILSCDEGGCHTLKPPHGTDGTGCVDCHGSAHNLDHTIAG